MLKYVIKYAVYSVLNSKSTDPRVRSASLCSPHQVLMVCTTTSILSLDKTDLSRSLNLHHVYIYIYIYLYIYIYIYNFLCMLYITVYPRICRYRGGCVAPTVRVLIIRFNRCAKYDISVVLHNIWKKLYRRNAADLSSGAFRQSAHHATILRHLSLLCP